MRALRFGLGMRIFFGFGILVAALVTIAFSGSYGLSVVGSELRKMDTIAASMRRLYERIPGSGTMATLQVPGQPAIQATIRDVSRGGMAVAHNGRYPPGADVSIDLPGGNAIHGRVVRAEPGLIAFSFRQDAASLARIDKALAIIAQVGQREAA